MSEDLRRDYLSAVADSVRLRIEVGVLLQDVARARAELAAEVADHRDQVEVVMRLTRMLAERDDLIDRMVQVLRSIEGTNGLVGEADERVPL